jgi:hypothetical protein
VGGLPSTRAGLCCMQADGQLDDSCHPGYRSQCCAERHAVGPGRVRSKVGKEATVQASSAIHCTCTFSCLESGAPHVLKRFSTSMQPGHGVTACSSGSLFGHAMTSGRTGLWMAGALIVHTCLLPSCCYTGREQCQAPSCTQHHVHLPPDVFPERGKSTPQHLLPATTWRLTPAW